MSLMDLSSCIGSAAAPFVLELDRFHSILPFGLMGVLSVVAALLCSFLPETKGMPTAEVYENNNNDNNGMES